MSIRRLALSGLVMALVAVGLRTLAPDPLSAAAALAHPQQVVNGAGGDALVLAVAGVLAWLAWAWGALGLLLTGLTALPGGCGTAARALLRVVLPAGARRVAAGVIGIGIGLQGPLAGIAAAAPAPGSVPAVPVSAQAWVPDWPAAVPAAPASTRPATAVPDWPAPTAPVQAADSHVVRPGDCLWDVATDWLRAAGRPTTGRDVAAAVHAWWTANATVIGPDPDLLVPGQVLQPPQAT